MPAEADPYQRVPCKQGFGFENKADVDCFLEHAKVRFTNFRLTPHESKMRLLRSDRFATQAQAKRGLPKPPTFDFFGFTQICGWNRSNG